MKKWFVIVVLCLGLLLLVGNLGCGPKKYTEAEARTNWYNLWYDQGYSKGLTEGRKAGYEQGYRVGADDGYKKGNADGLKAGKEQGYNEGFAAARKFSPIILFPPAYPPFSSDGCCGYGSYPGNIPITFDKTVSEPGIDRGRR